MGAEVVLVYPYFRTGAPHARLYHPLGIAHLAAALRVRGTTVKVIDCTFMARESVLPEIVSHEPKLVGIYVMLTLSRSALSLAEGIRESLPGTTLVCGGPLPTLDPGRFEGSFHAVFRGEVVSSFASFCADLFEGRIPEGKDLRRLPHPSRYPGLHLGAPGRAGVSSTPAAGNGDPFASFPPPDRSDYDHRSYQESGRRKWGIAEATVMTSYGCPHDCDFCSRPVFGRRFRRRRPEAVIEEIRAIADLGYDGLRIADDSFLADPAHARGICRLLVDERIDIPWSCLARVDGIEEEDVLLMRRAGCRQVHFGLESGSNEVLRLMNKRTTVEGAERAVRLFARLGIATAGFFMVGYPGESRGTVEQTFAWALSLPLEEVSFTVPFPLPGTGLFRRVRGLREGADWDYESENRLFFDSGLDEAWLRRRIDETCELFYEKRARRL